MDLIYNFTDTVMYLHHSNVTGISIKSNKSLYPAYTAVNGDIPHDNNTLFNHNNSYHNETVLNSAPMPKFDPSCLIYDFSVEAVMMGILCIFGFIGNIMSMICLWKDKSKTATPTLLISLEVADNLFLLTVFILRVMTSMTQYFRWGAIVPLIPYMGKYIFPCALIAETGTIYLTLLVTFNRYVSVCLPYEASNLCSIQHARRHVVLVWLFSCLYNLPRFFEYEIGTITDTATNVTFKVHELSDMAVHKIYQIVYSNLLYFLVMFLIPLITLTILNSNLIKALKRTKKKRKELLSQKDSTNRSEDDITLILIVVVLVFFVCQTPALITQLLISFLPEELKRCPSPFFYYERISDLLVVANSSINFLIYCFCSRKFRQILKSIVCHQVFRHSPDNSCGENGHVTQTHQNNHHLKAPNRSVTRYTSIMHSPKEVKKDTQF